MIQKWQRAFTLIELLIVVAIIAILAAIAVPNFLEAQVRSKISRLRADMRTIATAMEAYFTDHNGYPLHIDYDTGPIPLNARPWFAALTTPVAYLTSMPTDPFFDPRTLGGDVSIGSSGSWIHYEALWNTWG
ncbi:prepilin-type N-terminal cleavage/methylation domain-containing protein, partial [Candidatus Sumerlaeota bacterium]|nr:prepilin-type N-terminal cleavage/methylation domain-containing protein [Candidatus Sumerlaeota bacterium]